MKKILFYYASCFGTEFLGELMDEAKKYQEDSSNDVVFYTCGGVNNYCMFNRYGSSAACKWCKYCTHKVLKHYNIEHKELKRVKSNDTKELYDFSNADQLRSKEYRGVKIGLSIMSSYISLTRNMSPLINAKTKPYFDSLIRQSASFVDAFYDVVDNESPDVIYSYNGRFQEYRPIYDIGIIKGVQTLMIEDYIKNSNGKKYKVAFENSLPHNIKELARRIKFCWDNYDLSQEEKQILGESFYKKRRNGEEAGDVAYTANQKKDSIPDFKTDKINVAIMNSSEDEYAAVGDDWDTLKMFPTQYESIVYLLKNSPKNIHYYLRIHPNLSKVHYKYHTRLLDLPKEFNNITVIPATSEMSTYSILDHVDKVVGFGSTMCIESSFWGKPSILMGPAIFSYEDTCYVPSTPEEAIKMIADESLKPISNDFIVKFGAYFLNQDPVVIDSDIQYKYINFNYHINKFIINYTSAPYINFWGGEKLTSLIINSIRFILNKHSDSIPREEE